MEKPYYAIPYYAFWGIALRIAYQLRVEAARGHLAIPPSRMFVMDASAKVTGPNAYVTGIGNSKRIVVWDTTIHELSTDEILGTYGHEQGHYVLQHIPKGIAFSAVARARGSCFES